MNQKTIKNTIIEENNKTEYSLENLIKKDNISTQRN